MTYCQDCLKDKTIQCKRNPDAKCLICGAELCGLHIGKHLQKEHCVSLTWRGLGAEKPEGA